MVFDKVIFFQRKGVRRELAFGNLMIPCVFGRADQISSNRQVRGFFLPRGCGFMKKVVSRKKLGKKARKALDLQKDASRSSTSSEDWDKTATLKWLMHIPPLFSDGVQMAAGCPATNHVRNKLSGIDSIFAVTRSLCECRELLPYMFSHGQIDYFSGQRVFLKAGVPVPKVFGTIVLFQKIEKAVAAASGFIFIFAVQKRLMAGTDLCEAA